MVRFRILKIFVQDLYKNYIIDGVKQKLKRALHDTLLKNANINQKTRKLGLFAQGSKRVQTPGTLNVLKVSTRRLSFLVVTALQVCLRVRTLDRLTMVPMLGKESPTSEIFTFPVRLQSAGAGAVAILQ